MANPLFQLHLVAFDCIFLSSEPSPSPSPREMRGLRLRGNDGVSLRKRRMRDNVATGGAMAQWAVVANVGKGVRGRS